MDKKLSWPTLSTCMEKIMITSSTSPDSRSPGRVFELGPPEYKQSAVHWTTSLGAVSWRVWLRTVYSVSMQ
jgi:hypothetical protein